MYSDLTSKLYQFSDYGEKYKFTVETMADMARKYSISPTVRETAINIIKYVTSRDYLSELKAVHQFVRDRIKFVRDTYGKELLQTPDVTLRLRAGDCDDKTTLFAALMLSIGHPVAFSTIKTDGNAFTHVYPEVKIQGKWIPAETVRPVPLGVTARHRERIRYVLS